MSVQRPAAEAAARNGAIAVVGEALMDMMPAGDGRLFEAAPGGSPANVAVGLARLGVPARMIARIADDLLGRRLRQHLADNGVDLSAVVPAVEPSSLAIVAVGEEGVVEYDFRVDGTADWQWRDDEVANALDDSIVCLHVGSLAMTMPPGADVLLRFADRARSTATISYDPNCRPLLMGDVTETRRRIEAIIERADIVKSGKDDVAWLYPEASVDQVVDGWLGRGPALVAVTLGPDGVVAGAAGAGIVRRPGLRVPVVDTVGAGDAFMSALLSGLHRRALLGGDKRAELLAVSAGMLAEIMDEGVRASALTCMRHGADPPTAARMAQHDVEVS